MTLDRRVIPSLLVSDLPETLAFYETLGFRVTGRWPEGGDREATWAEVTRDEAVIHLHSEAPAGTPDRPVMSGTLYFHPVDVAALAREWKDTVEFAWGPEVMEYGMFEFAIRDPNGYYLAFWEPAPE